MPGAVIRTVLKLIWQLLRDGLEHGHFRLNINCELTQNKRRLLTIESGKSYLFLLDENEVLSLPETLERTG